MKSDYLKSIPYFVVFILCIGIIIVYNYNRRKAKLEEYGVISSAKILYVDVNGRGNRLKIDAVFAFIADGEIITNRTPMRSEDMDIDSCYQIVYVENEPNIVKLDYTKRVKCDSILKRVVIEGKE